MIIYGTKATHLRTQNIQGQCKNCAAENSLQMGAFQKYAHVFWIPLLPIGKEFVTQCSHCKQVLQENEVKSTYRTSFEDFKNQLRTPIWTFSGLGLIGLIIISIVFSNQKKNERNKVLIQTPQSGDVYEYRTKEGEYTLLKVSEIQGDTVYVFPNNYSSTKITGLSKLRSQGDSTYSTEAYPLSKSELATMIEQDKIIDIIR